MGYILCALFAVICSVTQCFGHPRICEFMASNPWIQDDEEFLDEAMKNDIRRVRRLRLQACTRSLFEHSDSDILQGVSVIENKRNLRCSSIDFNRNDKVPRH